MVAPQPKIIAHEESKMPVMRRGVKEAKKRREGRNNHTRRLVMPLN
jgi:hypothetical protein